MVSKSAIWILGIVVVVVVVFVLWQRKPTSAVTVDVKVPQLSQVALIGRDAFNARCSTCHGKNGSGTANGPPLIHKIYEPSHHADEAFYRAALYGVRSHHWPYGDMPPVKGISRGEVQKIVTYVREVQRANGIN